jgi:hypothetical protein
VLTCAYETKELGSAFPFHYRLPFVRQRICSEENIPQWSSIEFIPIQSLEINFHSKAKYLQCVAPAYHIKCTLLVFLSVYGSHLPNILTVEEREE